MALPKNKVSRARGRNRRAHWKLSLPGIVECPKCHAKKLAHHVCKNCGTYDGAQVIDMEAKEEKAKRKQQEA